MPPNLVTFVVIPCANVAVPDTRIPRQTHKLVFVTDGTCEITDLRFTAEAQRFTGRVPAAGGGNYVSYQYDGSSIPSKPGDKGAVFGYSTPLRGNGTGVIKN